MRGKYEGCIINMLIFLSSLPVGQVGWSHTPRRRGTHWERRGAMGGPCWGPRTVPAAEEHVLDGMREAQAAGGSSRWWPHLYPSESHQQESECVNNTPHPPAPLHNTLPLVTNLTQLSAKLEMPSSRARVQGSQLGRHLTCDNCSS